MYTYSDLDEYLSKKQERPLAHNTRVRREGDDIVVRLHGTDIVFLKPDGAVTLNSGGWQTPTTKERLNLFLTSYRLVQENHKWYLYQLGQWDKAARQPFVDFVMVCPNGELVYPEGAEPMAEAEAKKLNRAIQKYTKDYAEALVNQQVPAPDSGDCWYCLGDWGGTSHLLTHMEEAYYVPSLLNRANEEFPGHLSILGSDAIARLWANPTLELPEFQKGITQRQVAKLLAKYLRFKLGLA
jgi:hypothetical protein